MNAPKSQQLRIHFSKIHGRCYHLLEDIPEHIPIDLKWLHQLLVKNPIFTLRWVENHIKLPLYIFNRIAYQDPYDASIPRKYFTEFYNGIEQLLEEDEPNELTAGLVDLDNRIVYEYIYHDQYASCSIDILHYYSLYKKIYTNIPTMIKCLNIHTTQERFVKWVTGQIIIPRPIAQRINQSFGCSIFTFDSIKPPANSYVQKLLDSERFSSLTLVKL
jgi:hypothetical protein